MKKIIKLSLIFLILSFNAGFSQDLTFDDLLNIQKHDLEKVKGFFNQADWEFYSSKIDIGYDYFGYNLEYNKVGWAFEKSNYYSIAQGWAYLLQKEGFENIVIYQTYKEMLNKIENEAKNRLTHIETKAGDNELTTLYQTPKGIEFRFIVRKNADEYNYDKTYYTVIVLNRSDLDKRIEQIRLEEQRKIAEEKAKEEKYNNLISKGDQSFQSKNYSASKQYYEQALTVKPEESYLKTRIAEAKKMILFLEERKTKIYNYKEINRSEFENFESTLLNKIKNYFRNENPDAELKMKIIITTDLSEKVAIKSETIASSNPDIASKISIWANSNKPKAAYVYNYPVASQAEFEVSLVLENRELSVKKKCGKIKTSEYSTSYNSDISTLLSNAPDGKFQILLHRKKLNGNDFSNNKINKYNNSKGANCAFLSLLVPGWGEALVTCGGGSLMGSMLGLGGKWYFMNSPLATTVTVYGLIGVGAYYKVLSNQEYDKYLNATSQTEMDLYYDKANKYHHRAIIIAGVGAALWVTDVIWVAVNGAKYKKETKSYKNQLSFNYNPDIHAFSMGYSIKF